MSRSANMTSWVRLRRQVDRRRPERRRGALFMMGIAGILPLGGNVGCVGTVDDCATILTFEFASSGEPVAHICMEFTTTGSLGRLSPDEYLDRHTSFRTMTSAGGDAGVPMPISNRFGVDATHGVVNPIWIARFHLPDRNETIVFQRNHQYSDSDELLFMEVGEFIGSMGDTIVVTDARMYGCGPALVLYEGCTDEP